MAGKRAVITRVLAVMAAYAVTSCATFDKSERRSKDCHNDDDCNVTVSVVDCDALYCRAQVDFDELVLKGNNARFELDKKALDEGFYFDKDYGIWFKSFFPGLHFDCKPNGQMFKCKTKADPTGKRYYYAVQIRGPKTLRLLDPWVVN